MITILCILVIVQLAVIVGIWTSNHDLKIKNKQILEAYNKLKRRHAQVLLSRKDDESGNKLMMYN